MAIPQERFHGYLRVRDVPSGKVLLGSDGKPLYDTDGNPQVEQEVWVDRVMMFHPNMPVLIKPSDCCGILYHSTDPQRVFDLEYPDE